jgi:hypothetical protein
MLEGNEIAFFCREGRMSRGGVGVGGAILIHRIPLRAFTSYQAQKENGISLGPFSELAATDSLRRKNGRGGEEDKQMVRTTGRNNQKGTVQTRRKNKQIYIKKRIHNKEEKVK